MNKKTDSINQNDKADGYLDNISLTILRLLSQDCNQSYAELGAQVNLSAPAVFERVKQLKNRGVITGQGIHINASKIGRPLLCFIQVKINLIKTTDPIVALSSMHEIEEIHITTGQYGALLKVRTHDTEELEQILSKIHNIDGVESTHCQIALSTRLERGTTV